MKRAIQPLAKRATKAARQITDIGYTGQRNYGDFGLMDYNARFYSPSLGRFVQPDTIIPSLGNNQAWDRYQYGLNNPIGYTDSTGHFPTPPDEKDPRDQAPTSINISGYISTLPGVVPSRGRIGVRLNQKRSGVTSIQPVQTPDPITPTNPPPFIEPEATPDAPEYPEPVEESIYDDIAISSSLNNYMNYSGEWNNGYSFPYFINYDGDIYGWQSDYNQLDFLDLGLYLASLAGDIGYISFKNKNLKRGSQGLATTTEFLGNCYAVSGCSSDLTNSAMRRSDEFDPLAEILSAIAIIPYPVISGPAATFGFVLEIEKSYSYELYFER